MAKAKKLSNAELDFNNMMALNEEAIMSRLNCHNVGKILSFDPLTQTCTVEVMQIKQFNETYYIPAPITDVPLIIYGAGNAHITLPDPTGSICLLLFLDRNIDSFLETGERYEPETWRMHDFSDCIALTTFKTLANPIQEYDERAVSILNNEILENLKNDSYLKVYPEKIELDVTNIETVEGENQQQEEVITNSNVLIDNTKILMQNNAGGQISVSDKINIQNTAQSLVTLIDAFLTACEGIATVTDEAGGTLTAASKQAFTDLKVQFQELLQ